MDDTTRMRVIASLAPGNKCERCWRRQMDVGCHEDHPTLCSDCVFTVRALIRGGTVQPDNEVQRWWAENDLMMWKRPEAQRYDGLEEARNYVP